MNNPVPAPITTHGTCIALSCAGHSAGILLLGAPGTGKSSLALQLIDQPGSGAGSAEPVRGHLVSDDQVLLEDVDGALTASAPPAIDGLLEVRGIGIVKVAKSGFPVRLDMVVAHADAADIERMPEPAVIELGGRNLPLHEIDFSTPPAAAQVRTLALIHWGLAALSIS
ncbi:aldolase [Anderseniella sp. Alg231-50]|uniref:aldolase n=1 Tax=Anderseniella sp. Alg231-50 TaxID=1922226 RepID=UPI000D54C372